MQMQGNLWEKQKENKEVKNVLLGSRSERMAAELK